MNALSLCHRVIQRVKVGFGVFVFLGAWGLSLAGHGSLKGGHKFIPGVEDYKLVVKLRADTRPEVNPSGRIGFSKSPALQTQFDNFLSGRNLSFTRVMDFSEGEVRDIHSFGRIQNRRNTFNKADFYGLMEVKVANASKEKLLQLAYELEAFDQVEYASLEALHPEPPPIDFSPETPDLTSRQSYWGPDPGIDIEYAANLGLTGKDLIVMDMEHSWGYLDHEGERVHEDLHNQDIHYGLPWRTNDYFEHGQAVMGILLAADNGYGITGSVPDAKSYVFSILHGDQRILQAAVDSARTGDIILMEMQRNGGAPPQTVRSLFDIIEEASDAGIVIVETAGNGDQGVGQNLDASNWSNYRSWGDAGSIVVGAGSPNTSHTKLGYSTYGECCVHVQGWGSGVFTLGDYPGSLVYGGDNERQAYATSFGGTSAAGPIVTSAVALVQSFAKDSLDTLLTSREIRELLIETGVPQGGNEHIGPLPNIRAAIEQLRDEITPVYIRKPGNARFEGRGSNLIYQNPYPNQRVKISLYDATGSLLKVLVDKVMPAGNYSLDFTSGAKLRQGVYFAEMDVGSLKKTVRLVNF